MGYDFESILIALQKIEKIRNERIEYVKELNLDVIAKNLVRKWGMCCAGYCVYPAIHLSIRYGISPTPMVDILDIKNKSMKEGLIILYDEHRDTVRVFYRGRTVLEVRGSDIEAFVPGEWIKELNGLDEKLKDNPPKWKLTAYLKMLKDECEKWGVDMDELIRSVRKDGS